MQKILFSLATVIFGAISITGCLSDPCEDMGFQRFRNANRVEITDNHNNVLRRIENPAQIQALANVAISYKSGWGTPWAGAPIALVRANFFQGNKFLGDFGVGSGFLSAQGCGYFQSRNVNSKDRAVIIQLFGVRDPYADNN
jgi:hypothetical protein